MHKVSANDHMNHYLLAILGPYCKKQHEHLIEVKNCISYISMFTRYMHVRVVDSLLTNRYELLLISMFLYMRLLHSVFLSAERTAFCVAFSL